MPLARTPLTAPQRDVWAAHARFPELPQFNLFMCQRFTGTGAIDVFRECLARALRRNDALRLTFGEDNGVPHQWVSERVPDVAVHDFSAAADPRAACQAWIAESFARPFDLTSGPAVEAAILVEGASAWQVYLKAHHILTDGWGLHLVFDQVRHDYLRLTGGAVVAEPVAPSYVALAADNATAQVSAAAREHFRATVDGVEPALFERRAPSGARRSARHSFVLPRLLIEKIRERGESPFAVVAAAFATYLGRIHRTEDVVLGIPLLNRRGATERQTVGHFVNTLPLRVDLTGRPATRELVDRVQRASRELQRHERCTIGEVLRDRSGGAGRALFDVTLAYLQLPSATAIPGLTHTTSAGTRAHDHEALAVVCYEFDDTSDVRVELDYAVDVFDRDFPIDALARHVANLVTGFATTDRPVVEVPMVAEDEFRELVHVRNATAAEFPVGRTLHGLFEDQVARTPERIALLPGEEGAAAMTYAELDAAANRVAWALRDDGVGVGDRVAVLLPRGPRLVVAVLAVLKAGGAYVPVDPGYPAERIRFVVADSGARVVLTDADSPSVSLPAPVRRVDLVGAGRVEPLPPVATDRDLAYVIYTSGSTGQPKGVLVEHRSVVNRLHWMQRRYPIGADDVLVQKTPASFDVSVWELFWWGQTGARLALVPPGAEQDPAELLGAIERHRVTTVHFVPSMFGPFLDLVEGSADAMARVGSLRRIFCSGEALPAAQVNRFVRLFGAGGPALVNLYGPTEATVDVSAFDCPAEPVTRVPIGRPIDNIRLYVLGVDDQPQPVGAAGELCVSGVGVARGYLGRDELTEQRFVADPFVAGERMYRTGDLARWLASGDLEYLGRVDEQVKIRGNRVELGEVRHRLAALPGVRDAVVVDRHSPDRGVYLVGYYVAEADLDAGWLRGELATTLPQYMVPGHFVRIERIPLTANGKLDRRALPEPGERPTSGDTPRNEVEAVLAEVWARVLGLAEVGVHDDYYTLGGDSILMLRVRAEAARRGLEISLADMANHPTVAELAARATSTAEHAARRVAPFELVPGLDRAQLSWAQDAYPATRMHLGLLFHSREQEGSAVYHDVFRYGFAVDWDEPAFRWAFDRLVARHEVLRSSFDLARYSEPLQVVHARVADGLSIVDLRTVDAGTAQARVREHVAERRVRGYDFAQPPLYHFRVHVRPETLDVVFSFHHAILDGWSAATLLAELLQDYLHGLGADIDPVPEQDLPSPAEYVLAERRAISSGESRRFWLSTLDGATPTRLDPYVPHEPPGSSTTINRWVDLPDGLADAVQHFAHEHAVPARAVYLAAHCLMLRTLSGAEDITTGLFTHGRPELPGAERITGLFLNTMPIRLSGHQASWLAVVQEVLRREREALPHRRYPLSAIQEDHGGEFVVETAFNYVHLHVLEPVLRTAGIELRDFQAFEETNFSLIVHAIVHPVDGRMRLRLDCDGRTFTHGQVDVVARTYLGLLHRIVTHPDEAPGHGFLAGPPREVAPAAVPPRHVVSRFAEQVALHPDAIAVSAGETRWTYRELDRAANRIARRLIALGADNTRCVGYALDRSPELVAAVLGILRTGAACVPLDVSYPPDRLALMTEVAGPLRVLTTDQHAELVADPALVLLIDPILDDGTDDDQPLALPEVSLEDTACILFTSGSTGRPKGAELPHRPFAHYLEWQVGSPSGAAGGKTVQFAPPSFDVSFQEIFSTLSAGGTLQLIGEEHRRDPAALARLLDRERVERIFIPYVGLQQLAEAADTLGIRPRALRVIISSGEQLRVTEEIRRLCAGLPGTVLENQYGPTETHLVTKFTMTGDPARFPALPPIGPPMDYLEVHVLDAAMRPVPQGVTGEVYVGGVGLAHGYRGQPELTDKAFVPHPWRPGERLYRVGDLARELPSGDLVYLGRADNQVKVRGFRVEPAEVEFAILALAEHHPGIRETAVVARRRDAGDAFLAAFLVGDADAVDLDDVRRRLRATLPEYLVPSYFTWLPALPITPTGKRDDAALRGVPLTARAATDRTPPRDEHERALADIFATLLGLTELSVHDDFFAAGGTSLTAMRLIVMIEKHFGVQLPLAAFVAAPTVAELAQRLRSGASTVDFDPLVPIRAGGSRRPLFLVHPLGGNVLCYVRLGRHLPDDQPLYAIQAIGATPGTEPVASMEELAEVYLRAIRRVQPEGPYSIGGWSFGGFVAFEMARQLRRDGAEIADLIVIDSISLADERAPDPDDGALLEWFYWELLWNDQGGAAELESFPPEITGAEQRLDLIAQRAVRAAILPADSARTAVRRLFTLYQANWRALAEFQPGTTDLDMTLLRASQRLPEALQPMHGGRSAHHDPVNGWRPYTTGRVEVIPVPGDHLTLMDEPNVRAVAAAITTVTSKGEAS